MKENERLTGSQPWLIGVPIPIVLYGSAKVELLSTQLVSDDIEIFIGKQDGRRFCAAV